MMKNGIRNSLVPQLATRRVHLVVASARYGLGLACVVAVRASRVRLWRESLASPGVLNNIFNTLIAPTTRFSTQYRNTMSKMLHFQSTTARTRPRLTAISVQDDGFCRATDSCSRLRKMLFLTPT